MLRSVEIYDPSRDRWENVAEMNVPRRTFVLVKLNDGRVLAAGGVDQEDRVLRSTEIYDPKTNKWTMAANMNSPRFSPTGVTLTDGKVLVAGGGLNPSVSKPILNTVEMYNPQTNRWVYVKPMNEKRASHASALLNDGRVLVSGGASENESYLRSTEIYDPKKDTWTAAAPMLQPKRTHKTVILADGRVLSVGGLNGNGYLNTTELFSLNANSWVRGANIHFERRNPAVTIMANDKVLVAGGRSDTNDYLKSAEIGFFNRAPIVRLSSPINGAGIHISEANSINLRWTAVDPDGDPVTNFMLRIGTRPGSSDILNLTGSWREQYTLDLSNREPNQTYYWTVMARDVHGEWSDWADEGSFSVQNQSPVADFSLAPFSTDRLHEVSFINNSYDPDGDSLVYKWEYRLQGTSGWTQFSTDIEPKHKFPHVGKYDLRLTATDPYGATHSLTKHGFLEIFNLAPSVEPLSPPSNHVMEMGETSVNLKWRANDPEGDAMDQYRLKIGTTSGADDVLSISGNWKTSHVFDFSTRNPDQIYYWSVMGRDIHGDWSSWSPAHSFRVPKQLNARVEHAPRWESARKRAGRVENEFLAGEPFLFVAETSEKAKEVTVRSPFDTGPKIMKLTKKDNEWRGSLYDKGYVNLKPGPYIFTVTAKYDNGYEESVNVPVIVKGKLKIRVHRTL